MPDYTVAHGIAFPIPADKIKDVNVSAKLAADIRALAVTADAAITAESERVISVSRWARGKLGSGASLDTLTTPGTYYTEDMTTSLSVVGKPDDSAFRQPFKVTVERLSEVNGIVKQTAEVKQTGAGYGVAYERFSLSGSFLGWMKTGESIAGLDYSKITLFGDSQTEPSAGTSWPEYASPKLDGSSLVNYAKSGNATNDVLIHAGVKIVSFKVAGGSIPASGAVSLSTSELLYLRDSRVVAIGTLAGVSGTLRHVSSNAFTFTRASAGVAVAAAGWQAFTADASPEAGVALFWMGGNDFNLGVTGSSRDTADHVIGAYRAAMEWGERTGRRVVIAGVTNRLTALAGSSGFEQVQRINRELRRLFPDAFLDVQAYYVERAIYDAALTPSAEDLAAMGRGEIPPQLYLSGDTVHLIPAAHKAIAEKWISPWLAMSGYAKTTVALPALPALSPVDGLPALKIDTDGVPYF